MTGKADTASGTRRAALYALLGWGVPLLVCLPLAGTHESAGGEAALFAGIVWLFVLGPLGSLAAGIRAAGLSPRSSDPGSAWLAGFVVTWLAILPIIAYDAAVDVVEVGGAVLPLALPLVAAFCVGFGGRIVMIRRSTRRAD